MKKKTKNSCIFHNGIHMLTKEERKKKGDFRNALFGTSLGRQVVKTLCIQGAPFQPLEWRSHMLHDTVKNKQINKIMLSLTSKTVSEQVILCDDDSLSPGL